jgi:hypothetical protein
MGAGWHPLVFDLFCEIEAILGAFVRDFEIERLDDRHGALRCIARFEENVPTDLVGAVRKAIAAAEDASRTTCEVCGGPGRIGEWKWHHDQALCPEHAIDAIFNSEPPDLPRCDNWKIVSPGPRRIRVTDINGVPLARAEVERLLERAEQRFAEREARIRTTKSKARRRRLIEDGQSDVLTREELRRFAFVAEWE